jgi:hypothetical protein
LNEDGAAAGERFGFAFGDLTDVLKSAAAQIGSALIPLLTGLTNIVVRVVVSVRDWIKEHQALTQLIFYGTGLIVAGGIALKAFSIIAGIAGTAMTGLTIAYNVATAAMTLFDLVCAANPIVLVVGAVIALTAALAALAGYLLFTSGMFDNLGEDGKSSITAISNAIAKGDIKSGWEVMVAFLKVQWVRLTNFVLEQLDKVADKMVEMGLDFLTFGNGRTVMNAMGMNLDGAHAADAERLRKAEEELRAAQAAANVPGANLLGSNGANKAPGLSMEQQSTVAGTYSGIAAGLLGGGDGLLDVAQDDYALSQKWRDEAAGQAAEQLKAIRDLGQFLYTYAPGVT